MPALHDAALDSALAGCLTGHKVPLLQMFQNVQARCDPEVLKFERAFN